MDRNFSMVVCRETRGLFAARFRNETDSTYFGINYYGRFECTGEEMKGTECTWRLTRLRLCPFSYIVLDCVPGECTTATPSSIYIAFYL